VAGEVACTNEESIGAIEEVVVCAVVDGDVEEEEATEVLEVICCGSVSRYTIHRCSHEIEQFYGPRLVLSSPNRIQNVQENAREAAPLASWAYR
jgi:hypothetical protein